MNKTHTTFIVFAAPEQMNGTQITVVCLFLCSPLKIGRTQNNCSLFDGFLQPPKHEQNPNNLLFPQPPQNEQNPKKLKTNFTKQKNQQIILPRRVNLWNFWLWALWDLDPQGSNFSMGYCPKLWLVNSHFAVSLRVQVLVALRLESAINRNTAILGILLPKSSGHITMIRRITGKLIFTTPELVST